MKGVLDKIPAKQLVQLLLHRHLLIVLILTPLVIGLTTVRTLNSIGRSGNPLQDSEVELVIPSFKPDPATLSRIQELNDQEVEVAPVFEDNRNNPFAN